MDLREGRLLSLILGIYNSATNLTILPLTLFIVTGEIMFPSGVAHNMMDTMDKWLARIHGRLSILTFYKGINLFS